MNRKTGHNLSAGMPVALGGGAARGEFHPGFLHFLEDAGVNAQYFQCTSIGALVGTLYLNGSKPEELAQTVATEWLNGRFDWTNPFNVMLNASQMRITSMWPFNGLDLEEVMGKFVQERQLMPSPKLKLVSCQLNSMMYNFGMIMPQRLVIFEMPGSPGCGQSTEAVLRVPMVTQADLVKGLAASCCVVMPGIINPVEHEVDGRKILLADGGLQHPHYTSKLDPPTIVAKLIGMPHYSERDCDFVVNLATDMDPIFSSVSPSAIERMENEGYERTKQALAGPIEAGLIPTGGQSHTRAYRPELEVFA